MRARALVTLAHVSCHFHANRELFKIRFYPVHGQYFIPDRGHFKQNRVVAHIILDGGASIPASRNSNFPANAGSPWSRPTKNPVAGQLGNLTTILDAIRNTPQPQLPSAPLQPRATRSVVAALPRWKITAPILVASTSTHHLEYQS